MSQSPAPGAGKSLARRIHLPRAIGLGLGAVCVGVALLQHGAPPWLWAVLAFNGLAWPHFALLLALRSKAPFRAEHRNVMIDSALGGFWLPAMGFNLLPSILIITMLTMNNLAVGGRRLLMYGLAAQLAGMAMAFALIETRLELTSALLTILGSLPFMVVYPLTIGVITYHVSMRLSAQKKEAVRAEQILHNTLDAMEAGVVLYDTQDRVVLWNKDFEQLYGPLGPALAPGRSFEELLRRAVALNLVPQALGDAEAWVAARLREHAEPCQTIVRQLANGRWRRIVETRLPDGGLLAFSTDVTDLVQRERELQALVAQRDAYAEALQKANEELGALSETDALTGIANRRQFDRRIAEEWDRAQRHGMPIALLLVDVDHFKRYNDHHGHPTGDDCLRQIAQCLLASAQRPSDLVARYGGEEFALLLPHTDVQEAMLVAQRCLNATFEAAIPHGDSPVGPIVTLSIGVASARPVEMMEGALSLVRNADFALYEAKAGGRCRASLVSPGRRDAAH